MREIKFRAWEKSTRRMILDAHMEYDTITDTRYADAEPDSVVDQPSGTSFGFYLGDDDYIVMQFTGLHDKNGREIYEGDLIRVIGAESGVMVVHVDDIACLPLSTLYPAGEVIGNIHENQGLLE